MYVCYLKTFLAQLLIPNTSLDAIPRPHTPLLLLPNVHLGATPARPTLVPLGRIAAAGRFKRLQQEDPQKGSSQEVQVRRRYFAFPAQTLLREFANAPRARPPPKLHPRLLRRPCGIPRISSSSSSHQLQLWVSPAAAALNGGGGGDGDHVDVNGGKPDAAERPL